ncbi:hypothetical protein IH824_10325 [candidate division KSB1 bacterium]|nr:hypothetical protein [candidate division KSB1 bacterium]
MTILKSKNFARTISLIGFTLLITVCGKQVLDPFEAERIVLENDPEILNSRIKYFNQEIPLDSPSSLSKAGASKRTHTKLILLAEVEPPEIDGHKLQANHVTLNDDHAYVSYSTRNNEFRGGVEIFGLKTADRPFSRSLALFRDTDITVAIAWDDRLYLGGATDSDHNSNFKTPAVLEVITLDDYRLTDLSERVDLPSFNANDLACFDDAIFVTTGTTDGTLSIFDQHEDGLILSKEIKIDAAKAIDKNKEYFVVMEGTGTNLHLFDRPSREFLKTIPLGCPNFYKAKAEIQVVRDRIYLSAWDCGMMIYDLKKETLKGFPAPEGGHCNAISINLELAFTANGSDGLSVLFITENGFEEIGSVKFAGSTNFVATIDDLLFVANGSGGLKVLRIERN